MPKPAHLQHLISESDEEFDAASQEARDDIIAKVRHNALENFYRVRMTYRHIRSLPTVLAIPSDLREETRTLTDVSSIYTLALSDTPELSNAHEDMIRYLRYMTDRTRSTTELPKYTIHSGQPREVEFFSKTYQRKTKFTSSSHSIRFNDAVVLSESTIIPITAAVQQLIDTVTTANVAPYQIVLTEAEYTNKYFNSTPENLQTDLEKIAEDYTNFFSVDTISVHVTHRKKRNELVQSSNVEGGSGEGIPFKITARDSKGLIHTYWVGDVLATPSNCVLYAYHTWNAYKNGERALNYVLDPNNRARMTYDWREGMKDKGIKPVDGIYSIADIQNAYKHNFKVVSSREDLERLLPTAEDTQNICHYYYDCGHMAVIMHPRALVRSSADIIKHLSEKTVLNLIRPKSYKPIEQVGIVVVDIECYRDCIHVNGSTTYNHIPMMIGMIAGVGEDKRYTMWKGEDCIQKMFDSLRLVDWTNDKVVIWMHNGGGYDVHLIFDEILRRAEHIGREPVRVADLDGFLVSVSFNIITSTGRATNITFRDSCRLLPSPLEALARSYNLEGKVTNGVDILNATMRQLLHDPTYEKYLRRDCEILYTVLHRYQKTMIDDGYSDPLSFSTQSSFVKHTVFEKFYPIISKDCPKYPIYTMPRWLHEYIGRAYKGGRNELFHRGAIQGPIYVYDFTSLYPYVGTFDLPIGMPTISRISTSQAREATLELTSCFFGFVEVRIDYTPRTILPYYGTYKHHSYLFDYLEEEYAIITTIELRRMLELGYKVHIIQLIEYQKGPVLKEMFTTLFRAKREASATNDTAKALTAKLAIVSGYGSFGFDKYDRRVLRIYHEDKEEHMISRMLSGTAMYRRDKSGLLVTNEKIHVHSRDTNIAIAAFITAYARDLLYSLIVDIEEIGGKVYYCDTDSVFTNLRIEDYPELASKWIGKEFGEGLGELKREYSDREIAEITLATLKVYGIKFSDSTHTIKIKGVKKTKEDTEEDYEELKAAVEQDHDYIHKTTNTFHRGRSQKVQGKSGIEERERTVSVSLTYNKGIIHSDGSIQPLSGRRK
jgi:hypothetical protein